MCIGKQNQLCELVTLCFRLRNYKVCSDIKTAFRHATRGKIGKTLLSLLALSSASNAEVFLHRDGTQGAVASENEICSQIGIELIRQGVSSAS